jgi:hypothetical protein
MRKYLSIELRRQHYTLLNYLYHMRYIITEEQYDRLLNHNSLMWVKRRYDLVKEGLEESFDLMKSYICEIDEYERFEKEFFHVMMDCLHHHYYEIEDFNYYGMFEVLRDLFYVECTEFYFEGREKC